MFDIVGLSVVSRMKDKLPLRYFRRGELSLTRVPTIESIRPR